MDARATPTPSHHPRLSVDALSLSPVCCSSVIFALAFTSETPSTIIHVSAGTATLECLTCQLDGATTPITLSPPLVMAGGADLMSATSTQFSSIRLSRGSGAAISATLTGDHARESEGGSDGTATRAFTDCTAVDGWSGALSIHSQSTPDDTRMMHSPSTNCGYGELDSLTPRDVSLAVIEGSASLHSSRWDGTLSDWSNEEEERRSASWVTDTTTDRPPHSAPLLSFSLPFFSACLSPPPPSPLSPGTKI